MLITTTENIPGVQYQIIGFVRGATVQSVHIGKDILSGLRTIVGGEVASYTEMMEEAKEIAIQRMTDQAAQIGADAIVSVHFASSAIMQGAAEMLVYGTAVKFK